MVRNLTEEDYYADDYDGTCTHLVLFCNRGNIHFLLYELSTIEDDYYDDDDYYEDNSTHQQQYAPPKQTIMTAVTEAPTQTDQISVEGKAATTASLGVSKPPPGWGKPTPSKAPAVLSTVSTGVAKPPPGWGKPSAGGISKSSPIANVSSAGVAKPPHGWGKPASGGNSKPSYVATNPSAGVTKPPLGWGKPSADSSSNTSKAQDGSQTKATLKQTASANNKNTPYVPKPLPPILKSAKSQLSMVVLGHVDAGKSTMMGQVLVQVGSVSKREAQKNPVSWILDENQQERERGVTMEIGTKTVKCVA
jgi:hypothetical protein